MKLSRTQKILLAVLSAWPVVYIFIFFVFILAIIGFTSGGGGRGLDPMFGGGFVFIFVIHFLTIMLSLVLTVFYIIHAVKNARLDPNMRIVWIVLFFFFGIIAEPIYWYLEIWREKPPEAVADQINPPSVTSYDFQNARTGTYVPPNEPPDWR